MTTRNSKASISQTPASGPLVGRREFLAGSAGTVAVGSTVGALSVAPATAQGIGAVGFADAALDQQTFSSTPALVGGRRHYTLGVPGRVGEAAAGSDAFRLARRLEDALGDGALVSVAQIGSGTIDGLATGEIDLVLGTGLDLGDVDPAFKIFAGLPVGVDLDVSQHAAWLVAGGGLSLWDALGAEHGVKALAAGWTGPSDALSASATYEGFRGAVISAHGLAADVVELLGARVARARDDELEALFAARTIDAAQPIRALLAPVAAKTVQPGLMRHGAHVALTMRASLWNTLSTQERAIVTGVAAEANAVSAAEHLTRARMAEAANAVRAPGRPVVMQSADGWRPLIAASEAALDAVAEASPQARRIVDSHRAWRDLMLGVEAPASA